MKKIWTLIALLAITLSCTRETGGNTLSDIRAAGDTVFVKAGSAIDQKLKTTVVAEEPYRVSFNTSGVVKAIPTRYAQIASPFSGRISRSFVRLGSRVEAGSPVFEISSPDFYETGKAYYQTRQEMELARKNLQREKDLYSHGVAAQKEMEEAEVNFEMKKKDYENALAALHVFQIEPEQLVLGQPLIVRSPIAGEVVADNIVLGQYIKDDTEPVAIVADLNQVWVAGQVKEKDLSLITSLDEVAVSLVAYPDSLIKGNVFHISDILDEQTRSVEVLIRCDNRARLMKPGMYATVHYDDRMVDAMRIPTSALLQQEESHCLYVKLGEGCYVRRPVTTCGTDNQTTIVASGIEPGETVVTGGAFYLIDMQ